MNVVSLAWSRFRTISSIVGDAQGKFIASLFYFTVLVPFGAGSRLLSDVLRQRLPADETYWLERPPVSTSLEDAKRQG